MLRRSFLFGTALTALAAEPGFRSILPDANLTGWSIVPLPANASTKAPDAQAPRHWSSDGKVLRLTGANGHDFFRYDQELGDFEVIVEWRFVPVVTMDPRYNGGVFVRAQADGIVMTQAQTSLMGGWLFTDRRENGALQRDNLRGQMTENRVKPAGEWNRYLVRCVGNEITLNVNGAVTCRYAGQPQLKGYMGLEAENYAMEFRRIDLREL